MSKKLIIFLIILVLLTIYFIYGYLISKRINISKYIIESNKIPDEFNHFKIVQLSDLHNMKHIDEIYKNIIDENPNIIVVTGDMINYDSKFIEEKYFIKLIDMLNNNFPIYYINGNHELKMEQICKKNNSDDYNLYINDLRENNVKIIENEKIEIVYNNKVMNLYGLKETSSDYLKKNKNKAFFNGNIDITEYNILLAHNPLKFDIYEKWGFDLILSGHVHGGEIRLPIIGGVLSPERTLFAQYSKGVYVINNTKMIVSAGLGDRTFKLRINNPYDFVCIELIKVEK